MPKAEETVAHQPLETKLTLSAGAAEAADTSDATAPSRRSGRTHTGVNTDAVNSVLFINGAVAGHPTPMLVDTGSGITIVQEDVWQEATTKDAHQSLGEITHPVFAANGEELDVAGRAAVTLSIRNTDIITINWLRGKIC